MRRYPIVPTGILCNRLLHRLGREDIRRFPGDILPVDAERDMATILL